MYSSTWLVAVRVAAVDHGAEVLGTMTATAALPSSTAFCAAAAVVAVLVSSTSLSSLLVRMLWMAAPAFWPASAPPLSRFATTTLVAAMSNPPPPPKAKPSRAARASGATSIMMSAGRLRSVLRRSFQAMARILVTPTGAGRYWPLSLHLSRRR